MTDSNRDSDSHSANDAPRINADDAPLAPCAATDGSGAADAAAEPVFEDNARVPGGNSKDIVLQRLSPRGSWDDLGKRHETHFAPAGEPGVGAATERRSLSMAAIAIIAAMGGGLASAGAGYFLSSDAAKTAAADQSHAFEVAIAKLNTDLAGLKASGTAQSGKIIERIDRIEKAQAEPAAKLAKLSEAVDKLRASETTGSITASSSVPETAVAAMPPNRLPIVQGWALRDVGEGAARVEGRLGIYEVYPGDPLPGLGRVDAIRKQDGRWVVVTSRGLIVAR